MAISRQFKTLIRKSQQKKGSNQGLRALRQTKKKDKRECKLSTTTCRTAGGRVPKFLRLEYLLLSLNRFSKFGLELDSDNGATILFENNTFCAMTSSTVTKDRVLEICLLCILRCPNPNARSNHHHHLPEGNTLQKICCRIGNPVPFHFFWPKLQTWAVYPINQFVPALYV